MLTDVLFICLGLTGLSMLLGLVRLIKGPSLADRAVALDFMSTSIISFIGLFSILYHQSVYLDVAIAVALITFLATVAYARFIEWKSHEGPSEGNETGENVL